MNKEELKTKYIELQDLIKEKENLIIDNINLEELVGRYFVIEDEDYEDKRYHHVVSTKDNHYLIASELWIANYDDKDHFFVNYDKNEYLSLYDLIIQGKEITKGEYETAYKKAMKFILQQEGIKDE